ncbi:MAG: hypothetical protein JSS59_03815 [Proteobacteria bacterium]|nr:hypothetical protein [Pseudomonadota bacterium]
MSHDPKKNELQSDPNADDVNEVDQNEEKDQESGGPLGETDPSIKNH